MRLLNTTPASTSSSESTATGNSACRKLGHADSTASSADAPPGGCRQRSANMAKIAPPTATPAASAVCEGGNSITQAMPISADTVLPPMTDHGCASGLDGTANTSTALAPMGATSHGSAASGNDSA